MSAVDVIQLRPVGLPVDVARALVPGRVLPARVVERHGDHGLLVLVGRALVARLPADVTAGAHLRLRVAEAGEAEVRLEVVPDDAPAAPATAPAAPTPMAVPLPTGGRVTVVHDAAAEGGDARGRVLTLRYESAALGRVDLQVARDAVLVSLPEGAPAALARDAAAELSAALGGAPVAVRGRTSTVDRRA